ncbi:hypothetical protein CPB84DRAFT_90707 [Gymnopilus junonius]|uniref:Nephrocystin 3-like N-terminal domain-containing protein n=1 Tax=Gymnopilus junonius TaxID=109634 RepID=A0A9P5P2A5_GYMJU|nr:hypothetical protein CPB84DRAFT_90707 [Gymnopilus junonius]
MFSVNMSLRMHLSSQKKYRTNPNATKELALPSLNISSPGPKRSLTLIQLPGFMGLLDQANPPFYALSQKFFLTEDCFLPVSFSSDQVPVETAEKFIPSLAYQLALSIPDTRPLIVEAIERDPLLFSASLWDQAQALIINPIHAVHITSCIVASSYPRIFVIDGLDECSDPYKQQEIMQVLLRVLQHLPIPFAVLIASRPEYNIQDAFNRGDLNNSSARLSLDNEYKANEDIKKYLIARFRTIRRTHPLKRYLPSPWPPNGVLEALMFKASGQFIYASTVDKFISSPRHRPEERLDIVMNASGEPFEQLDLLYSAILSVIDSADLQRTLHILALLFLLPSWLLLFKPSNSPKFLEKLLGLQAGDVRRLLFGLESLLTVDRGDESSIRIFHTSLSDYLFDKSRARRFWIDTGEVCAEVAERLLPHSLELWAEPRFMGWLHISLFIFSIKRNRRPFYTKPS